MYLQFKKIIYYIFFEYKYFKYKNQPIFHNIDFNFILWYNLYAVCIFFHHVQLGGVTMAKNSLALRRKLTTSAFYKFAYELATDYANTAASTARTVLCMKYDITESTFYTLLSFAITHYLVSEKTAQRIFEKILANQSAHGNNGYDSTIKHKQLLEERKKYSDFSKKDIADIARYYANHPELTKAEVAKIFRFESTKPLDQILKKACIELIISDTVFEALRKRAISKADEANMDRTVQFFDLLFRARTEAKKAKKTGQSAF